MTESQRNDYPVAPQPEFPPFVGWMLWNIVRTHHVSRGAQWADVIFEDLPADQQLAWNRAAADLQGRAKAFGRLI